MIGNNKAKFVAGNWKMNGDAAQLRTLTSEIVADLGECNNVALFPPNTYLWLVREILRESTMGYGAQNVARADNGAHTGEISASMLVDMGCRYVIVGHSERRHTYGEDDTLIAAKMQCAILSHLCPILCVGETKTQRENGDIFEVITQQLTVGLAHIPFPQHIMIAYEPVWAIGSGKAATPKQIMQMHEVIHKWLAQQANECKIAVLYGGSVNADNADAILSIPQVDGVLVGGSSLKSSEFVAIAKSACAHY